jgi:NAD(P)-dependent dehydrogenase (short-subunit alcohol dehydrogenase family)
MIGKVCLITGATSGLGFATARHLAALGATVVVVGRNAAKCSDAVLRVREVAGDGRIDWLAADFAEQRQVRELADEFRRRYSRLDVLVNNAGAIVRNRQVTPDGVEMTLAVNHVAPFLMTNLLLDVLLSSAPARVINVASVAHERARVDFDDLGLRGYYVPFRAYARSKLANLLFTYELARRLEGSGVTANAVNPGLVRTGLGTDNGLVRDVAWRLTHLRYRKASLTPEQGADTICFLASSPDVASVNGRYFFARQPIRSSDASYDRTAAERLWSLSERLSGLPAAEQQRAS